MTVDLGRCWRVTATGFGFAAFGLGAVLVSIFIFPPLRLLPIDRERCGLLARQLIRVSFRGLLWFMVKAGVMRLEVTGADKLRDCRNVLVLANHPTLIDVVVLISLLPAAGCIVKRSLWRNPFLAGVVSAARYIANHRPETMLDDCTRFLSGDQPLIIFPEGTRSGDGGTLRFQRGASYVALRSGRPILPVIVRCDPPTLRKGGRWYEVPPRAFCLRIEVRDRLHACDLVDTTVSSPIAARNLTRVLEDYFSRELATHG